MRDGRTRRSFEASPGRTTFAEFAERVSASLVVLSGDLQGSDYAIEQSSLTLGRGPGVDLAFDDETLSRQHATLEFADGALRVRDMGSLNGVSVNGGPIECGELKHGDRLQLGDLVLQLILEERPHVPKVHVIEDV
jgi:pSer/pThr/pTyr-binding forkhead associated (FHA) protein